MVASNAELAMGHPASGIESRRVYGADFGGDFCPQIGRGLDIFVCRLVHPNASSTAGASTLFLPLMPSPLDQ